MSYTFDNLSRIGVDSCVLDQYTIQNAGACSYMTQNFFAADCTMRTPIALATTQPGIMYQGGHGTGAGGCNIDDNSRLLIGGLQTHPKSHIDLFQRPYITVPYLGRGSVHPVTESQLLQGEQLSNRRSVNQLTEKSYSPYLTTPFVPAMEQHFASRTFESDADSRWVRGGIPVRELQRDVRS